MTFNRPQSGLHGGTFLDMTSDPNLQCGLFQFGIFRPDCWAASEVSPANDGTGGVPIEAWVGIGMAIAGLLMLKR